MEEYYQADKAATAFRSVEKLYQLHYEQILKPRKDGKLRGCGTRVRPTDLSQLIDPDDTDQQSLQKVCVGQLHMLRIPEIPGFCLIRNALSAQEQACLIADCLRKFPEYPATTNHSKAHGRISHLWQSAVRGLFWGPPDQLVDSKGLLKEAFNHASPARPDQLNGLPTGSQEFKPCTLDSNGIVDTSGVDVCMIARDEEDEAQTMTQDQKTWHDSAKSGSASARSLLAKLRWTSLGPNFDWSARKYLYNEPYRELPNYLAQQALRWVMLATDGGLIPKRTATEPRCSEFKPDAALVNYYAVGDSLGGHSDDVEEDLSKPIVSISLGCDAVFLQGGLTRHSKPAAILVRSGDVLILADSARRCYHGVPRIFHDRSSDKTLSEHLHQLDEALLEHMAGRRINVSIRDTR